MVKRGLLVFFLGVLAVSFGPQFAWGAKVTQAPPIEALPIIGESSPDVCRSSWSSGGFTEGARLDSVGPEGDPEAGRSVLGTPGKNIWVCPGYDTILVIYGQPSGQPNNIFYLWMAYSYDGGVNWENAASTIGPGASRRIYPGVITPANATVPYIAYQHAENDGANYTLSDVYFSYDEFFPFMLYTPVRVGADDPAYHAWLPSIATTPAGDTVLIAWQNGVTGTTTGNCYLKRSFDGGLTWTEPEILMVNTQGNPSYVSADTPRMQIGEGGYIFALFNWEEVGTARFVPFYTESSDYGATWSTPTRVWPTWPPPSYPDAKCWWYCYDVVLDPADNYRPHCAIKLGAGDFEFGDVWECHPTAGAPGNWTSWTTNLLIGDGIGGNYATQPSIGMDANGDLGITFAAFFIHGPGDTSADVGICKSYNQGANWTTAEPVTHDGIVETCVELASQFGDVDDALHGIYDRERDNCQSVWHFFGWTGVEETDAGRTVPKTYALSQNTPNPVSSATRISYHLPAAGDVSLTIYDLTGRLVKGLVSGEREPGFHDVVWDGKAEDGSLAPAGVYFYRLRAGSYAEARKLVVLR